MTPQEYVQVIAPYAQMLQYIFYLFNKEYDHTYELGTP